MTENTKIQMFKTKVVAMINKLNCVKCCKPDNTSKVSTNKLLCSKWCCQEQSSQYVKFCVACPYCKKKEEPEQGITPQKGLMSSAKCCNWCSKSQ